MARSSSWSFIVLMVACTHNYSTCQTLTMNSSSPSPPQLARLRHHSSLVPAKSGSILEHIDKDQVERYLNEIRLNQTHQRLQVSRRPSATSSAPESLPVPSTNPKLTIYEPLTPDNTPSVLKIRHRNHRNRNRSFLQETANHSANEGYNPFRSKFNRSVPILQSSKDALFVTRKEYLRSDWCKTQPLLQRITEEGCLSYTFLNRFCYGQCNSFFIPKNIRPIANTPASHRRAHNHLVDGATQQQAQQQQANTAFRSCAFCKPKKTSWVTVTLKCPSLTPPYRRRRVQSIKQCRCITEVLT